MLFDEGRTPVRGRGWPFTAASIVTIGAVLLWPIVDWQLRAAEIATEFRYYDFSAYSNAVDAWIANEGLYVADEDGGYHGSYLYPPISLVVFYPFTRLSVETGAIAFGGFSVALLWIGLQAAASALDWSLGPIERVGLLAVVLGFQPVLFNFKMGQVSTFLAALLCLAFYANERESDLGRTSTRSGSGSFSQLASGALTTLAATVKLFYATAGAHLLRNRGRFFGATTAAALVALVSLFVFGIEQHRAYLDVLTWGKGWGESRQPQLWGPAYFRPLVGVQAWSLHARIAGVVAVIALTLATRNSPVDREVFALGVAAVPLFAPRAYTFDLVVLLLPALVLLTTELDRQRGYPTVPVVAVLLVHLHAYGLWTIVNLPAWVPFSENLATHAAWLQPGLWGTTLLVALAAVRVAQHALAET